MLPCTPAGRNGTFTAAPKGLWPLHRSFLYSVQWGHVSEGKGCGSTSLSQDDAGHPTQGTGEGKWGQAVSRPSQPGCLRGLNAAQPLLRGRLTSWALGSPKAFLTSVFPGIKPFLWGDYPWWDPNVAFSTKWFGAEIINLNYNWNIFSRGNLEVVRGVSLQSQHSQLAHLKDGAGRLLQTMTKNKMSGVLGAVIANSFRE